MDKLEETRELLRSLKNKLPRQTVRTIKGQMKAGDIDGALRGLQRIARKQEGKHNEQKQACRS